ncbi:hypothetical protein OZX61_02350 [Acinetobacter sp. ESL0695]|uniref:hypothetical protein n=1 Tax=Acinetobacter sp. ESL0695 TaxID=2983215 RepID=UPI0023F4FE90|nr:hypothetical protein [Acinetobacter sp. ESL0695]WEV49350.1 hypothetical protein OZX61_02350 [Acinetobacter sp. ESL0695]
MRNTYLDAAKAVIVVKDVNGARQVYNQAEKDYPAGTAMAGALAASSTSYGRGFWPMAINY